MTKLGAVADHLDDATMALVEKLAIARGISSDRFAAEAIRRVAESEADLMAFIQVGIDAADRGDFVPHEVVMAELDRMRSKYAARCG